MSSATCFRRSLTLWGRRGSCRGWGQTACRGSVWLSSWRPPSWREHHHPGAPRTCQISDRPRRRLRFQGPRALLSKAKNKMIFDTFFFLMMMICDPGRWKCRLRTLTWLSDALRRLVHENVRWRDQNEKVHFTKTSQIKILRPWVSDGADLRKEAPGHTQLGRVDLKDLGQQLCYRGKKRENACKYTR